MGSRVSRLMGATTLFAGAIGLTAPLSLAMPLSLVLAGAATTPAEAYAAPRLKPPAPGPAYISSNNLERINVIRSDLSKKNYTRAYSAISNIDEPVARSLAQWFYYDAKDPNIAFEPAVQFLNDHPDWPGRTKLQGHIEETLLARAKSNDILSFFDERDPVTTDGKMALARALYSAGQKDAADAQIRNAWVNDNLTRSEENTILSLYGGALRKQDHSARVDRLLWGRQVTSARRSFARLGAAERRRAEARALLLLAAKGAPTAYYSLPKEDRADPGVTHAAVRYFRRADEEPKAVAIARDAPTEPGELRNAEALWSERQLLMRWALTERRFPDAYAMAAGHGLENGSGEFAEAEFNAGWIALRYLDDPERAKTHFAALVSGVSAPISLARGYYWVARSMKASGDEAEATRFFQLAAEHLYTYYGQLAAEELGGDFAEARFTPAPDPTPEDEARFASRSAAQALRMLTDIGDDRAFLFFSYALDDVLESPGEYQLLADAALRLNAPHVSVRAGKVSVKNDAFAPQVSYPLIYVPDEATRYAPPELILGISRQESEFNPRAYSSAGARGMMQLLPSTAELTARKERIAYRRSDLLNDALYNMTIGSAHLSHLLTRYNGSYPMVFAAYNAGPHRVTQWVERYGDPRSPAIDPIDWIEQIPFGETRNYVQRVLENMQVYRSQFEEAPIAGKLAMDIERGGTAGRVGVVPPQRFAGATFDLHPRILAFAKPVLAPPPPEPVVPPVPEQVEANAEEVVSQKVADNQTSRTRRARNRRSRANDQNNDDVAKGLGASLIAPPSAPTTDMAPDLPETDAVPKVVPEAVFDDMAPSALEETAEVEPVAMTPTSPLDPMSPLNNEANVGEVGIGASTVETGIAAELGESPVSAAVEGLADSFADDEGDSDLADNADQPNSFDDECLTYTEYMAETDEDGADASDLNAGQLAELESGGPTCG